MEIGGKDEGQSIGHNGKFNGKRAGRFAIELRENFGVIVRMVIVLAKGMAGKARRFPDVNAGDAMKPAEPDCGKAGENAEAAPSGICDDFELIFEKACTDGDAKRAAIIFRAANDDESGVQLFFGRVDVKKWKAVSEKFAKASEPVGKNADAGFEIGVDSVDDGAVGAGSADAEKIALKGNRGRSGVVGAPFGVTERDARELAAGDQASSRRNVPGNAEFFRKDIRGSGGKDGERRFGASDSVNDFVDGAVAAANDDHFAAAVNGVAGEFGGGTGAGSWEQTGIDSGGAEDLRRFFEGTKAARTAAAAGGVIDDDGVANLCGNGPQVSNRR